MFFLLVIACANGIAIASAYGLASSSTRGKADLKTVFLLSLGPALSALFLSLPVFLDAFRSMALEHGRGVRWSSHSIPVSLLIAGAVLSIVVYGTRLYRQFRMKSGGFRAVGANAAGIMIGAYILFVAADHLSFARDKQSGMLNWELFRTMHAVEDIACASPLMVINTGDPALVAYRCPDGFVLGRYSDKPLIPWPGYTAGKSAQLAVALKKMYDEAVPPPR